MKEYSVYVSGCFDGDGQIEIDEVREQFRTLGYEMHVKNMSKLAANSALEVIGHEMVSIPYAVLDGLCDEVGDERLKDLLWRIGRVLTRDGGEESHFAVCVDKIPTNVGAESIKCRIGGESELRSAYADGDENVRRSTAADDGMSGDECGHVGMCESMAACEPVVVRDSSDGREPEREDNMERKAVGEVILLARDIKHGRCSLLKRGVYFGLYNAHVFFFERTKGKFAELDIDEEIRRRIEE